MLVRRFDSGSILRMERTPEGFIQGVARVTRTGVFTYKNADGTLRRELRHPDQVFSASSLNSLKMIPITNLHPSDKLVNADTAKSLSIGYTGENVMPDGKFVTVPIKITSKDGVAAIEAGRKELSLGYEVELDEKPGRYDDEDYDCVQQSISYNHLAIVDRGRAGADVRLNIDGSDAIEVSNNDSSYSGGIINQQLTRRDGMPKIVLDSGLEYEAAPEVAVAFNAMKTKLDAAEKTVATVTASMDKLRADADTAIETAKQLQLKVDGIPEAIATGVKNRAALLSVAHDSLDEETVKKLDSMSDADIKKAVILSRFPEAKLDGMSEEYIQARFDAAVEVKNMNNDAAAAQRAAVIPRQDGSGKKTAEQKRDEMIERMKNQYKEGDGCGEKKK